MKCVVTTSFLVSTGAVSNTVMLFCWRWTLSGSLIKTVHRVNPMQLRRCEKKCFTSQTLNYLAVSVCWCIVMLQHVKSNYPHRHVNTVVLGISCGCNGKTSTACHQWTRWSSPSNRVAMQHLTAPVETRKLAVTTHFTTLQLCHN